MKRPTLRQNKAFTLIEMLIAMAIVVFLVVLLSQILAATQGIWRGSETRTDPFRDARAVMELMERELAWATPNDKAPALALENICPTQPGDVDGPAHNQQVYSLIPTRNVDPTNASNNKSDMCAVGFYCTWDTTKHAYILRRHFLGSDGFSRMQAAGLPANSVPAADVYEPSVSPMPPVQDEDVAAYVWDFKVVPYRIQRISCFQSDLSHYLQVYAPTVPRDFIQGYESTSRSKINGAGCRNQCVVRYGEFHLSQSNPTCCA